MSRAVTKNNVHIRDRSVIRCGTVMLIAAVISMSTVFGKPSPFAASFAAAMSGIDCISAFVGSVAGYILGGNYSDGVTVHLGSAVGSRYTSYHFPQKNRRFRCGIGNNCGRLCFCRKLSHLVFRKRYYELHYPVCYGRRRCSRGTQAYAPVVKA